MVRLNDPDDPYNHSRNLRRDVWPLFPQIVNLEKNFSQQIAAYKKLVLARKGLLPDPNIDGR